MYEKQFSTSKMSSQSRANKRQTELKEEKNRQREENEIGHHLCERLTKRGVEEAGRQGKERAISER